MIIDKGELRAIDADPHVQVALEVMSTSPLDRTLDEYADTLMQLKTADSPEVQAALHDKLGDLEKTLAEPSMEKAVEKELADASERSRQLIKELDWVEKDFMLYSDEQIAEQREGIAELPTQPEASQAQYDVRRHLEFTREIVGRTLDAIHQLPDESELRKQLLNEVNGTGQKWVGRRESMTATHPQLNEIDNPDVWQQLDPAVWQEYTQMVQDRFEDRLIQLRTIEDRVKTHLPEHQAQPTPEST